MYALHTHIYIPPRVRDDNDMKIVHSPAAVTVEKFHSLRRSLRIVTDSDEHWILSRFEGNTVRQRVKRKTKQTSKKPIGNKNNGHEFTKIIVERRWAVYRNFFFSTSFPCDNTIYYIDKPTSYNILVPVGSPSRSLEFYGCITDIPRGNTIA